MIPTGTHMIMWPHMYPGHLFPQSGLLGFGNALTYAGLGGYVRNDANQFVSVLVGGEGAGGNIRLNYHRPNAKQNLPSLFPPVVRNKTKAKRKPDHVPPKREPKVTKKRLPLPSFPPIDVSFLSSALIPRETCPISDHQISSTTLPSPRKIHPVIDPKLRMQPRVNLKRLSPKTIEKYKRRFTPVVMRSERSPGKRMDILKRLLGGRARGRPRKYPPFTARSNATTYYMARKSYTTCQMEYKTNNPIQKRTTSTPGGPVMGPNFRQTLLSPRPTVVYSAQRHVGGQENKTTVKSNVTSSVVASSDENISLAFSPGVNYEQPLNLTAPCTSNPDVEEVKFNYLETHAPISEDESNWITELLSSNLAHEMLSIATSDDFLPDISVLTEGLADDDIQDNTRSSLVSNTTSISTFPQVSSTVSSCTDQVSLENYQDLYENDILLINAEDEPLPLP